MATGDSLHGHTRYRLGGMGDLYQFKLGIRGKATVPGNATAKLKSRYIDQLSVQTGIVSQQLDLLVRRKQKKGERLARNSHFIVTESIMKFIHDFSNCHYHSPSA